MPLSDGSYLLHSERIPVETFSELSLKPEIMKALQEAGFEKPMPIQARAIPVAMEGRDVIGGAQTGTGKTAAFTLPMLNRLTRERSLQGLILAPTRELAVQIGEKVREFSKYLPVRSATIYGGVDLDAQTRAMKAGVQIIIATPGRLLDHLRRGNISLASVKCLVLDEADRMLDMGFLPDVELIIAQMPNRDQTMLFSATLPPEVQRLAVKHMKQPVRIQTAPSATLAAGISHRVYPVPHSLKDQLLIRLLTDEPVDSVLIFTRTRRGADRVADFLEKSSLSVERLHSDRTQRQRQRALNGFRAGRYKILVATDIAARGLDIPSVSHVVNYNLPERHEDYVHRAGRTARADGVGNAFCLLAPEEIDLYYLLEKEMGREKLVWTSHPDFDYLTEPPGSSSVRRDRPFTARPPQGGGGGGGARRGGSSGPFKPRRPVPSFRASANPTTPGEGASAPAQTPPAFGRRRSRPNP